MPTRHLNNIREDATTVSFDCVVRDDMNALTYGGGRVTLLKADLAVDPLLDPTIDTALLETAIENAVAKVIAEGNEAFPKARPRVGSEPESFKRRLHAIAVRENLADRPGRRDPFGAR